MSSPNGKIVADRSPARRSSRNNSVETHRTRRSHRSRSRSRDRHGSRHLRPEDDKRKRGSRSRERKYEKERSHRDKEPRHRERRSRSRERSHRDRERGHETRDRDRDRERRRERDEDPRDREHRSGESRHSHRDRPDRDREMGREDRDRRERRRKRPDYFDESPEHDERSKRKRDDLMDETLPPPPPPPYAEGLPPPPPPPPLSEPMRRTRSRDSERRYGKPTHDARDEFEDGMRDVRRDRDYDRGMHERRSIPPRPEDDDDDDIRIASPTPLSPPAVKRPSPSYEAPLIDPNNLDEPKEDDSEARSVFVSQLAARMTARDLGYFFEDKLGENSVMDSRIVTDRLSRRSKGIAYVEFRSIDLVDKAIALTGTIVMGLPIMIQHTESERNKTHAGDGSLNLPPGVSGHHGAMQLYVGSLHFNLTESDIKQVFEPFGELEFVDLHRDPTTGRSKGYAFVQYKRPEDAKMALEQMEGFELAGRTLRVNTVHEKGSTRYTQQDSLDENGGGNLNAASRQALMQKLARIEAPATVTQPIMKPTIPQAMVSKSVLLRNMFDPDEETEPNWDTDLGDDVKGECESKYGKVLAIKVEKDSQGEIYLQFDAIESARKAIDGLNGRWFGGKQISAAFISDAIMQAHR